MSSSSMSRLFGVCVFRSMTSPSNIIRPWTVPLSGLPASDSRKSARIFENRSPSLHRNSCDLPLLSCSLRVIGFPPPGTSPAGPGPASLSSSEISTVLLSVAALRIAAICSRFRRMASDASLFTRRDAADAPPPGLDSPRISLMSSSSTPADAPPPADPNPDAPPLVLRRFVERPPGEIASGESSRSGSVMGASSSLASSSDHFTTLAFL
mmetsp:Transcript_10496/g.48198  ORF Transcript_10496/g.48198 Transcript_10496/m.48198 type:complete len:210 (-) Transcript_10496:72-701(-)